MRRIVTLTIIAALAAAVSTADTAKDILEATGVKGGLVVHVGCGDGTLTAALRASDSYLVQGLDTDSAAVGTARQHIQSKGLYGAVCADTFDGKALPYIDNLVNLVVAENPGDVAQAEVMRVLAPEGVAYVKRDGKWAKTVKPRPDNIDVWTHYMHDPSNNAVAHDDVIGPPRRLQWQGSPRFSRQHDHMSSVSALVCTGSRIFYVFDEATRVSILTPPDWKLIARDAFNGTILWKRDIPNWYTHMTRLKSGPATLPRRLVAVGDRVYVTLGIDAPLTALDAATGETIRSYENTAATEEILLADGILYLAVSEPKPDHGRANIWAPGERHVAAVDPDSGKMLWETATTLSPLTLAVDADSVYFHDGERIVALDRADGGKRWASEPLPIWSKIQSYFAPTLVVYEDVVLYAGGEKFTPHRAGKDMLTALSAKTGKKLWVGEHPPSGYQSPEDVLVADGLVWCGATTSGGLDGKFTGRDPQTGEVKVEFTPDVKTYWFHHRCYRGRATDNYLLMSRTGVEFLDLDKKSWEIHHWVRGACLYGIMPCNGMIYAPQHPCGCYPESKQHGFSVLAPADQGSGGPSSPGGSDAASRGQGAERLEKGPAYGGIRNPKSEIRNSPDWPTFRRDNARSGRTTAAVPTKLKPAWKTRLGGRLSTAVMAEGKVFVASVDTHTVHALDAESGKPAWEFRAGGRVDSPPTVWQGRALFGSADGHVYCLRASDGELAWKFRAAPADRRTVVFEQVESLWPVHGSVLVQDAPGRDGKTQPVLFCAAGRSMFLDGGVRMLRLDPATGELISENVMDEQKPDGEGALQDNIMILNMPVAQPDILSSDGKRVFMKSQVFDLLGKRQAIGPHSGDPGKQGSVQRGEEAHLFCPSGFLDDSWWHRTYWVYGRSFAGGHGGYWQAGKYAPSGRIMVCDEKNAYIFGRKPQYYRWTTPLEHHLWAADKMPPELPKAQPRAAAPKAAPEGWVSVENAPDLNPAGKALAVEAWVKAEKPDGVVVARGGPADGYALVYLKGRPHFMVRSADTLTVVAADRKAVGKWVHLAGVLADDKKVQIYVDGKPAGTAEAPALIANDPKQTMEIGADGMSAVGEYKSPFGFTGLIDEVRVYFGALTSADIARHASEPGNVAAAGARLVARYTFDKGDATDDTGGKHSGTVGKVKIAEGKLGKAIQVAGVPDRKRGRKPGSYHMTFLWSEDLPLFARAMVMANDTIFIAGPPDIVDEDAAVRAMSDTDTQAKLAEQAEALAGRKGAVLRAVSARDGSTLAEYRVDVPPVFNGMIAAQGKLFWTTIDGQVVCWK